MSYDSFMAFAYTETVRQMQEKLKTKWTAPQQSEASAILSSIRHKSFYQKSDLIEDMLPCKQADGVDLWIAVNN